VFISQELSQRLNSAISENCTELDSRCTQSIKSILDDPQIHKSVGIKGDATLLGPLNEFLSIILPTRYEESSTQRAPQEIHVSATQVTHLEQLASVSGVVVAAGVTPTATEAAREEATSGDTANAISTQTTLQQTEGEATSQLTSQPTSTLTQCSTCKSQSVSATQNAPSPNPTTQSPPQTKPVLGAQQCHKPNTIANHGPIDPDSLKTYTNVACRSLPWEWNRNSKAWSHRSIGTRKGTKFTARYNFLVNWIDGCSHPDGRQNSSIPLQGNNDANCFSLFFDNWKTCEC